jgi:hypothetical protein
VVMEREGEGEWRGSEDDGEAIVPSCRRHLNQVGQIMLRLNQEPKKLLMNMEREFSMRRRDGCRAGSSRISHTIAATEFREWLIQRQLLACP